MVSLLERLVHSHTQPKPPGKNIYVRFAILSEIFFSQKTAQEKNLKNSPNKLLIILAQVFEHCQRYGVHPIWWEAHRAADRLVEGERWRENIRWGIEEEDENATWVSREDWEAICTEGNLGI